MQRIGRPETREICLPIRRRPPKLAWRRRSTERAQTGGVSDFDDYLDGPPCPACGTQMQPDGVDTAEGLESCHRCPRCKLVLVIPGH